MTTPVSIDPNDERTHVFISYSWTSPDHQQWIKGIAEELTEENLHVLFDGWDLAPGADTLTFMERSVNDPKVTKVIIFADKKYVEKANGRSGGVGTETQIISPEIYNSTSPGKFVVVVCERDEDGKPYLPTYYKSKMFIDFSDSTKYADEYNRLLRWIYDKPADVRPAYGKTPAFVTAPDAISLGVETKARRALDALQTGKSTAVGAFAEYLNTCASNLERFRIVRSPDVPFDDQVNASIEALRPFKDQLLNIVEAAAVHTSTMDFGVRLHAFFEAFFRLTERPAEMKGSYTDSDFDNFAFLLHETFLATCALLLKKQRFDLLMQLVAVDYYLPRTYISTDTVASHDRFSAFEIPSLEQRNRRLSLRKETLHGHLLLERVEGTALGREDLIQIDLVLFLRSQKTGGHWYPTTYPYAAMNRSLEVFARAASATFFDRFKPVLGVASVNEFKSFMSASIEDRRYGPAFGGSYTTLVGLDKLGTRP